MIADVQRPKVCLETSEIHLKETYVDIEKQFSTKLINTGSLPCYYSWSSQVHGVHVHVHALACIRIYMHVHVYVDVDGFSMCIIMANNLFPRSLPHFNNIIHVNACIY